MPSVLSRREMLSLLLGVPAAAWACRHHRPREYAGRLVGSDKALGHRILGAAFADDAATHEEIEIAIVGSGVAGLSAAWRFERQGEPRYVVLELESRAGGTSCYGLDGIVPYPWAAHYLPVPDAANVHLTALLREVGALEQTRSGLWEPAEHMLVRAPEERLFIDGRWAAGLVPRGHMRAADWDEFRRFQRQVDTWTAYRDEQGRRAFTLPLAHCSPNSPWIEADGLCAADWLERENYHSAWLRWWLEYGCRDDYGCTLQTTSTWALMLYHAARVPVSGAPSAPFLTWPEGNGHLVRHLEAVAGVRIRRQQLVVRVTQSEQTVELLVVRSDGGAPYRLRARHVVLAVPHFIARRMLGNRDKSRSEPNDSFSYAPWLVANLHVTERPLSRGFPICWDNVLFDSPSLGYVVATHQTLRDDGPSILTYYFPFTEPSPRVARERLAQLDHAACCDLIMSDLTRAHPDLSNLVTRIDVWRWGHAMIRPTPGLIWGGNLRDAREPNGRIHFANTDLSGVALFEEAHAHGIRAADAILKERRDVPVVQ